VTSQDIITAFLVLTAAVWMLWRTRGLWIGRTQHGCHASCDGCENRTGKSVPLVQLGAKAVDPVER
jgi:hypothetical protein